jgi:folate-binding protein YgfZ
MSGIELETTPLVKFFESLGYNSETVDERRIIKSFDSTESEINSLFNGAALRDISDSGILELSGKDVLDFLHRISTNVLKETPEGAVAHTIFTNEKGRIIDTSLLMNFGDYQLLIGSNEHGDKIMKWIEKYIITDDVKLSKPGDKYILLELLGPQTDSFITLICGNVVNEIGVDRFRSIRTDGIMFFLIKMKDNFGHLKYWILADQNNGVELIKMMLNNKDIFDFNLVGEEAYNYYRIVQGIPTAPNEVNDQFNPHEAGLLNLVSFTKGCYIGQEVIARLDTYDKVQKNLKGLTFEESIEPNGQLSLYDNDGKDAGTVTSVVYSPRCKKFVGLAYVRKPYIEKGTELIAQNGNDKKLKVTVENLPFKK